MTNEHDTAERAAVVAWLRDEAQRHDVEGRDPAAMMYHHGAACALMDAAAVIERGEHVEEDP